MKMSAVPSSAVTSSAMRSPAGDRRGAPYPRGGTGIGSSRPSRSIHTSVRRVSAASVPASAA